MDSHIEFNVRPDRVDRSKKEFQMLFFATKEVLDEVNQEYQWIAVASGKNDTSYHSICIRNKHTSFYHKNYVKITVSGVTIGLGTIFCDKQLQTFLVIQVIFHDFPMKVMLEGIRQAILQFGRTKAIICGSFNVSKKLLQPHLFAAGMNNIDDIPINENESTWYSLNIRVFMEEHRLMSDEVSVAMLPV